jgi:hypothetical protein
MLSKRLYGAAMMAAVIIPSTLAGCSDDGSNPLCCTEFKVGATIQADIGGGAESQVAVQAVADFAGIASAAIDDITAGCRAMAQDLDAPKDAQATAEGNADKRARMDAWCKLAITAIGSIKAKAGGTLTIDFKPPVCEASISAKANCQAKCSGSASCDIKANPPTCEGGKLEVACKGSCEAKAGATLSCTGKCEGNCSGSCDATGGSVECSGKCEGTCTAGGTAGGNGIQADGTCKGMCSGKCEVTAPNVSCSGTCGGTCSASCTGTAEASVKCDGECKADYEPLKCSGGELKGGCKAEAKCEGNCDASVKAKAECRPPELAISFSGAADVQAAGKLRATFEANLGVILAFRARLEAMGKIAGSFSGNISAVTDIKAACIPPLVAAVGNAVQDVQVSAKATVDIAASAGAT